MFKILLLLVAALAASNGDSVAIHPRFTVTSSYTLFTNDDPNVGLQILPVTTSINALRITGATNCAIIVHGVNDRGIGLMSTVVRDAFLTSGTTNVIIVDWSGGANDQWANDSIESVTRDAVELIRLLAVANKINAARLHLVGFDMGAHIVGVIGRRSTYNIARITGLNPSSGLTSFMPLLRTDANYVEVIHTEIGTHGIVNTMGDVDFYPHGGKNQAGCQDDTVGTGADAVQGDGGECSHNRAWELFAASLTHGGIIGYRCTTLSDATSEDTTCTGFTLPLGANDSVKYGAGMYRLQTNAVYPYRCLVRCGLVDRVVDAIDKYLDD